MRLTYESNGKVVESVASSDEEIIAVLDGLHPEQRPYVILTRENRDYLQCAGSASGLAIEVRFYIDGPDSFKHFVIGRQEMSKAWVAISCKVGPINVLGHEELKLADAREIFLAFFGAGTVPDKYLKRNITKYFK